MLPFFLPDLFWWQWLLCAAGLGLIANFSYVLSMSGEARNQGGAKSFVQVFVFGSLFVASVIATFLCVVLAVKSIANIKWFG